MMGAELKRVVNRIPDDATILSVTASHANGVKRNMATFYANMAMDITFEISRPVPGAFVAEEVLAKARAAAKVATSYEGLFQALKQIVVEAYPTREERLEFQKTSHIIAMRSILNAAAARFDVFEAIL